MNQLSSETDRIRVYVGSDGKLHFVNKAGADSVLPFSSGVRINRLESSNGDGNNSNSVAQITISNATHIEIGAIGLNNPDHYNTTMLCSITAGDENIYRTTVPAQNVVREIETPATIKIYISGWQTYAEDIAIY